MSGNMAENNIPNVDEGQNISELDFQITVVNEQYEIRLPNQEDDEEPHHVAFSDIRVISRVRKQICFHETDGRVGTLVFKHKVNFDIALTEVLSVDEFVPVDNDDIESFFEHVEAQEMYLYIVKSFELLEFNQPQFIINVNQEADSVPAFEMIMNVLDKQYKLNCQVMCNRMNMHYPTFNPYQPVDDYILFKDMDLQGFVGRENEQEPFDFFADEKEITSTNEDDEVSQLVQTESNNEDNDNEVSQSNQVDQDPEIWNHHRQNYSDSDEDEDNQVSSSNY